MSNSTDITRRLRITTFTNYAQKIKTFNLPLNKDFIRNFDLKSKCASYARKYLDLDVDKLVNDKFEFDDKELRLYIRNKLGIKILDMLRDSEGELIIDLPHMLVALAYERDQEPKSFEAINTLIGLTYLVLGAELSAEWDLLIKSSTRGIIQPNFECSANYFSWKRCPFVLRKYAMYLTKPEGYDVYYYEKPYIAQIAYLISTGLSMEEATDYMHRAKAGLFFNFLAKDKENSIVQEILMDKFYSCNGVFANAYKERHEELESKFGDVSVYNVFNSDVRPHMVEMMGFILKGVLDTLAENGVPQSEAFVYHISPYRIGVAVKEGTDLATVLPELHEFMKPVPVPDLLSLMSGVYL